MFSRREVTLWFQEKNNKLNAKFWAEKKNTENWCVKRKFFQIHQKSEAYEKALWASRWQQIKGLTGQGCGERGKPQKCSFATWKPKWTPSSGRNSLGNFQLWLLPAERTRKEDPLREAEHCSLPKPTRNYTAREHVGAARFLRKPNY